jgi:AcrR family transcriptional regulator
MPKKTFINLDKNKQDAFVNAFLREFTIHRYDDASVSSVLKELGLAKGSFYQYFENKKDLFLYLVQLLSETKLGYMEHINRSNFNDFWDYWKAMYKEGIHFDSEQPLMSNFGYRMFETMNSPTLKPLLVQFQQQGLTSIKTMIQPEIDSGAFRKDIDPDRMAFFIINSSRELMEFMMLKRHEDFEARIAKGAPLFKGENEQLLFDTLDDFIRLQSAAINAKN